ncbi:MAG: M23 family metallopeptidase [Labilithrix sp.]|nr:M23 family metallopeptidase [Labilithrix sp.]
MTTAVRTAFGDRWLWVGLAVLAFVVLGAGSPALLPAKAHAAAAPRTDDEATARELGGDATCPPETAPDGEACVHLTAADDGPVAEARANTHRERSGRVTTYEQIPRLPERPADYDLYRYPIPPGLAGGHHVVSGYDLDLPDAKQRRGPTLRHVGHGAVDLPQVKGTPVQMLALEHQEGDAEVLYAGALFGLTVLTRHTLREGGRTRDYVMLLGHLDSIAPGVGVGTTVKEGQVVGAVGDTGSPSLVHLHLEIRRVREGIDLARVPAGASMIADSVTVVCDPRNVLPLR